MLRGPKGSSRAVDVSEAGSMDLELVLQLSADSAVRWYESSGRGCEQVLFVSHQGGTETHYYGSATIAAIEEADLDEDVPPPVGDLSRLLANSIAFVVCFLTTYTSQSGSRMFRRLFCSMNNSSCLRN